MTSRRPVVSQLIEQLERQLFEPADDLRISAEQRFSLAVYVTALHRSPDTYGERLPYAQDLRELAQRDFAPGPYGVHKSGGALEAENAPGPFLELDEDLLRQFGRPFALVLRYAHLLILHPRDIRPNDLQELFDAGWTQRQVVAVAQIVSALALLVRVRHGEAVLAEFTKENAHA